MPSVHLRACSFAHAAGTPILGEVTLDLAEGWTGVVGPNGAGKTTLLELVAGKLVPTAGEVRRVAGTAPVLCRQRVEELDPSVRGFAEDWSGLLARWRSRLGLDPDDLDRWKTLSPGERRRWQVGAALAAEPDVLLLDEPTNHVDADARDVLLDALRRFQGVGLVVSHDRTLLDALTTDTVRVAHGRVQRWSGPYREARQRWQAEEHAARRAHDRARREERRLRGVLADVRRERSGAEHAPRAARRAARREPDAREAGRKFAQQKAEKKLANRVHQLNRRVERAGEAIEEIEVHRPLGGDVTLHESGDGRRWVARLAGDVRHRGGAVVLSGIDLAVGRGDHVHVLGPNGAGKTSLVRALAMAAPGTVGWLPQELDEDAAARLLEELGRLGHDDRGRVLGIVATLGVDPARLLVTSRPSPGEVRKLALARVLDTTTDLVVLDEPTNHLDLPSVERLEAALSAYAGAVVLVTHDLALADATTSTTWHVREGSVWTVGRGS